MISEFRKLFGAGPASIAIIVLMSIAVFAIENALGFGKIVLGVYHVLLAVSLFAFGLLVMAYAVISLPLSKRGKQLVTSGAYKHVRHPIYSSIIFLLYPAISILLGSWLLLLSTVLVYLIFKVSVRGEEKALLEAFSDEYRNYMKKVPRFFPRLV